MNQTCLYKYISKNYIMASHQTFQVDLSWNQVKKVLRPKIINNDIATMKNHIDHLMQQNIFFKNQINKLEDDVENRDIEVNKLNNTIIALKNQINALRLELGNVRIIYENTKNHYNRVVSENKKLTEENTNNSHIVEKNRKVDIQNGMLISKVAKLTKELDEEKKRVTGLNIYNDELIKENKKLQEQYENVKKQNVLLIRQLENAVFSLVAQ